MTPDGGRGSLADLRVLDASNLIAGPLATMLLADLGAEVVKIEHPVGGDSLRNHGGQKDGHGLWWKVLGRGKLSVTLDLANPVGQGIFRRLSAGADVVVENFRPGTMARWGIDYPALSAVNPGLVMAHVSGFGQHGPLATQPGFGTLAESMSGFAHRNGQPDGPPTLPPFGLADTVTGITTAFAIMSALWARRTTGTGQEVDVSIIEPLLTVLEPQLIEYDQLGSVMSRVGNRSPVNAPRNMYLSQDGRWVAISTSTQSTANRLLTLVGHPRFLDEPWFQNAHLRAEHCDELDAAVGEWVGMRTHTDVLAACREVGAPAAVVFAVPDILADPQYAAIGAVATVEDPELGPLRMANTPFRLSTTPPRIRWSGPALGAHTAEVYERLGIGADELAKLRAEGVV
ncbi:MAG: CoA transferase [Pseudonocardiales bacterium]|nr:CoA transferase [Pseudonocardiales bacterium]